MAQQLTMEDAGILLHLTDVSILHVMKLGELNIQRAVTLLKFVLKEYKDLYVYVRNLIEMKIVFSKNKSTKVGDGRLNSLHWIDDALNDVLNQNMIIKKEYNVFNETPLKVYALPYFTIGDERMYTRVQKKEDLTWTNAEAFAKERVGYMTVKEWLSAFNALLQTGKPSQSVGYTASTLELKNLGKDFPVHSENTRRMHEFYNVVYINVKDCHYIHSQTVSYMADRNVPYMTYIPGVQRRCRDAFMKPEISKPLDAMLLDITTASAFFDVANIHVSELHTVFGYSMSIVNDVVKNMKNEVKKQKNAFPKTPDFDTFASVYFPYHPGNSDRMNEMMKAHDRRMKDVENSGTFFNSMMNLLIPSVVQTNFEMRDDDWLYEQFLINRSNSIV